MKHGEGTRSRYSERPREDSRVEDQAARVLRFFGETPDSQKMGYERIHARPSGPDNVYEQVGCALSLLCALVRFLALRSHKNAPDPLGVLLIQVKDNSHRKRLADIQ